MINLARQNSEEQPDVNLTFIAPAPRGQYRHFARLRKPQPPCDRRAKTAASAGPSSVQMAAVQLPSKPITRYYPT